MGGVESLCSTNSWRQLSSLLYAGRRSRWPKAVPVSLTPVFSKYFCLFWSNPGNQNCSLLEADLIDQFLTSLSSSEVKNAKKLCWAFTEQSEFLFLSWLSFSAILCYQTQGAVFLEHQNENSFLT